MHACWRVDEETDFSAVHLDEFHDSSAFWNFHWSQLIRGRPANTPVLPVKPESNPGRRPPMTSRALESANGIRRVRRTDFGFQTGQQVQQRRSRFNSSCLRSAPQAYPESDPSLRTTRW